MSEATSAPSIIATSHFPSTPTQTNANTHISYTAQLHRLLHPLPPNNRSPRLHERRRKDPDPHHKVRPNETKTKTKNAAHILNKQHELIINLPTTLRSSNNILENTIIDNTPNTNPQPLQSLPNKIILHRYDAPRYSLPNSIVLDGEGPWNVRGEEYKEGGEVKIIYTPGSTLGSLSVLYSKCLFSGNAIPMTRRLDCSGVLSDFEVR